VAYARRARAEDAKGIVTRVRAHGGLESGYRDGHLSFGILSTRRTAVEASCQGLHATPAR